MEKKVTDSGYLTIKNNLGLVGNFSTIGAGVRSLTLDDKRLTLMPKEPLDYLNSDQFFGKTLGRVAGRIPGDYKVDDVTYHLIKGADSLCLHGGEMESLSFKDFKGTIVPKENASAISFFYHSPSGEAGFPGNVDVRVTYEMPIDENELRIYFEAQTDLNTPISLSNHIYWNIFSSKDVNSYRLKVNASKYGVFHKGNQLVEKTADVPECLDFRELSSLKDKLDLIEKNIPEIGTLDHAFLFDNVMTDKPQIILDTPELLIECYTDFDGVNIYVDSSMKKWDFANGDNLLERRAIAIEPQIFPKDNIILTPNQKFSHFIRYRFIKK